MLGAESATLIELATTGDIESVRNMLVNQKKRYRGDWSLNGCDEWGNTPLHYAANSGSVDMAELLLSNVRERFGYTYIFKDILQFVMVVSCVF